MHFNTPQLGKLPNWRLARQLIASAVDTPEQLGDELHGRTWSEIDIGWLQNELAKRFGYLFMD